MKKALLEIESNGEIDLRECKKEEEHISNDDMVEMVCYSGEKLRVKSPTHSYIVHLIKLVENKLPQVCE
jgi:hypothetical protein